MDFETAFETFKGKYRYLRAELITVQSRLRHSKDIVTAGLNIAFRYLFPESISESSSKEEVARNLDADIQGICRSAEKEDQYVDWVEGIVSRIKKESEEKTKTFIGSLIYLIKNPGIIFSRRVDEHIIIVNKEGGEEIKKEYLAFSEISNKLYVLVEFHENEAGYKIIDRILVASNNDEDSYVHYNLTYVDVDSLGDATIVSKFKDKVGELINRDSITIRPDIEGKNMYLAPNFDSEDIEDLVKRSDVAYMGKPLFLFLLFQELKLTLLDGIDTYTLITRRIAGSYLRNTGNIIAGGEDLKKSIRIAAHEVAHSRFRWLEENKRDLLEEVIGYFKRAHSQFFDNIGKTTLYGQLDDENLTEEEKNLGKLNELIAHLIDSLTIDYTTTYSFKNDTEGIFLRDEPIYREDIEQLAKLGFIPDWARPSNLGYEKNNIDQEYFSLLFKYYTENCSNPTLLTIGDLKSK